MPGHGSIAAALRAFYALTLLRYLPIGLLVPVLVVYMAAAGLSLAEIGFVAAVQGVVVLVLELPTGGLADAWGRRPLLACASVVALSSTGTLLLAESMAAFALAWALQGVHRALDSGALESWYVDAALAIDPDRSIETDLSRAGGITFGAVAAGSVAAGGLVLIDQHVVNPLAVPLIASLGFEALHLVGVLLLLREVRTSRGWRAARGAVARTPTVVKAALRLGWSGRSLRLLLAVEISWGAGLTALELLWQPRTRTELGGQEDFWIFGVMSAAGWLAGAGGALLLPVLLRAFKGRVTWAAASLRLGQGATLAGLGLAGGLSGVVVGFVAFYVVHGASNPAHNALLHRRVPPSRRSTVLSLNSLIARGSSVPAGLLLGVLADGAGIPFALVLAGAVVATATPLYLLSGEPSHPHREGHPHPLLSDEGTPHPSRDGRPTHHTPTR